MARTDLARIADILWPADLPSYLRVWAVLDGARDDRIFGAVDGSRQQKCCLYAGTLPWQLQMAAPYLVELDREDKLTDIILRNGWGNAWGIFLHAGTTMNDLRKHLRSLIRVRDESGRKLIFRYYDPRVLQRYLPTCWTEELRIVFGPIHRFLMESHDSDGVLEFSFDGVQLKVRELGATARVRHEA